MQTVAKVRQNVEQTIGNAHHETHNGKLTRYVFLSNAAVLTYGMSIKHCKEKT